MYIQPNNTYQNALQAIYNPSTSFQQAFSPNQSLYQNNGMSLPGATAPADPMGMIGYLVSSITQLAQGILSIFGSFLGQMGGGESSGGGGILDLFGGLAGKLFGGGEKEDSSWIGGLFKKGASFLGF